ncbi:hypothetical protein Trydic_g21789 [Trypoxylus dichotomus]
MKRTARFSSALDSVVFEPRLVAVGQDGETSPLLSPTYRGIQFSVSRLYIDQVNKPKYNEKQRRLNHPFIAGEKKNYHHS